MTEHSIQPLRRRRIATLAASAAILLAGCMGSSSSAGPSASAPPESTFIAQSSFAPSPTPESTTVSPIPSLSPSVAPSESPSIAPSVEPSEEPSAAPTDPPLVPFGFGATDPVTGLRAEMLQVGQWTATFQPSYQVTLTWNTPTSADTVVRVEGVTMCYGNPKSNGKPCVTPTTDIAARDIVLITHGHASDRTLHWTWPAWEDIGQAIAEDSKGEYFAVIVRFTTGSSTTTVVLDASQTCTGGCTY